MNVEIIHNQMNASGIRIEGIEYMTHKARPIGVLALVTDLNITPPTERFNTQE